MTLVLRDNAIVNQKAEDFVKVFKSKIESAKNMDKISQKKCPDLDHFVVYSSISTGRGNAGQTNYGMANSAMERLCENRRKHNLPGTAIQWGPIAAVGSYESLKLNPIV